LGESEVVCVSFFIEPKAPSQGKASHVTSGGYPAGGRGSSIGLFSYFD
tara:strand:+ start:1978 stop:2121 length:144 start_codon:yes stop_codon:yes gene_type:complete